MVEPRQLDDPLAADLDRAALGLEPLALAGRAGLVGEVARVVAPHALRGGLLEAAQELVDHALPLDPRPVPAGQGLGAQQDQVAVAAGELGPRGVEVEPQRAGEVLHELEGPPLAPLHAARPRLHRPVADGEGGVGDDQVRVHLGPGPQPLAVRAGAERRVEGEVLGGELAEAEAAGVAGVLLGVEPVVPLVLLGVDARPDPLLPLGLGHDQGAAALAQRGLRRVGEAGADPRLHHQAIDHQLHVVLQLLVQGEAVGEGVDHPVHPHPREAALLHVAEHVPVLALAVLHQRGQHHDARALGQLQDGVDDLLGGLLPHHPAAGGTVLHAHGGVEDAQVVVHLGDGAHRGARVVGGGLLLDGDGGREPADGVVAGLLHLPQELPGVAGERLDVAPLSLGVDRVEGERRLPRPRDPGEDHQLSLGDLQVDGLEVVLARPLDGDEVGLAHGSAYITDGADVGQARSPSARPSACGVVPRAGRPSAQRALPCFGGTSRGQASSPMAGSRSAEGGGTAERASAIMLNIRVARSSSGDNAFDHHSWAPAFVTASRLAPATRGPAARTARRPPSAP